MCIVSMMHDHYQKPLKDWLTPVIIPTTTSTISYNITTARTPLDIFEELLKLTKELDTALGMEDCESAHKTKWMDDLRRQVKRHHVKKIEERLGA